MGRSSTGGKGARIDVRRGLRFQSPEAICSGMTNKVSPHLCMLRYAVHMHWLLVTGFHQYLCSAVVGLVFRRWCLVHVSIVSSMKVVDFDVWMFECGLDC